MKQANEQLPERLASTEGLGAGSEARSPLADLLPGPFVPKERDERDESDLEAQAEASRRDIQQRIFSRLAKAVAGTTTKDGRLRVRRTWHGHFLSAYVIERRGSGLLVQADGVQVWLPARRVFVVDEATIDVPEWLVRQRAGQFDVVDCRSGPRPRPVSWNSDGGAYEGGA